MSPRFIIILFSLSSHHKGLTSPAAQTRNFRKSPPLRRVAVSARPGRSVLSLCSAFHFYRLLQVKMCHILICLAQRNDGHFAERPPEERHIGRGAGGAEP